MSKMKINRWIVLTFILLLPLAGVNAGSLTHVLFTEGGTGATSTVFREGLATHIGGATQTLDIAIYNLTDPTTIAAIKTVAAKGVKVNVFTDGENNEAGDKMQTSLAGTANVTIKSDGTNGDEMHHKFVIVDAAIAGGASVFTGSANFTTTGLTTQNNNAIIVLDDAFAKSYKEEFDRLFVSGLTHQSKGTTGKSHTMDDGTVLEVRFAPGTGSNSTLTALNDVITASTKSFYYAIYTFGTIQISNTMIANKAVSNFGWFDKKQANFVSTSFNNLAAAGLSVTKSPVPVMHHKYLVSDVATVVMGSANFTAAADSKNDENQVIIKNNTTIAQLYVKELNRIASQTLETLGTNTLTDTTITNATTTTTVTTTTSSTSPNGEIRQGPNPVRLGSGSMTFTSAQAGLIKKIEIYDMSGRLVHTIAPSSLTATEITWDGRNNQGGFLGSGMYFYRAVGTS
ncbi:MAG: T9SS type A sorting domain-containing protein, partial [Candidatus Lindowbacteria bacterium]|nr:T9SS type A sorting domain-containing protein [Candidatus Lindowbacteria bacterium]